jgi:hypothetical protein
VCWRRDQPRVRRSICRATSQNPQDSKTKKRIEAIPNRFVVLAISQAAYLIGLMRAGHGPGARILPDEQVDDVPDNGRDGDGYGVGALGTQRADIHLSGARRFHLDRQRRGRSGQLCIQRGDLPVKFVEVCQLTL